jgi:hypothetical protein
VNRSASERRSEPEPLVGFWLVLRPAADAAALRPEPLRSVGGDTESAAHLASFTGCSDGVTQWCADRLQGLGSGDVRRGFVRNGCEGA